MKAMATTFHDDDGCAEVEVISAPSSTGLVRVRTADGSVYVRSAVRVFPTNAAARELLGRREEKEAA